MMKILIIDDEKLIRECLFRIAQSRKHDVRMESNGLSALKTWQSFQPQLVFLDICLPGLDGISLLKKMGKKNKEKVVMMSAHRKFSRLAPMKGVDLFVSKPFHDIIQLFNQAEDLLFLGKDMCW